MSGAPTRPVSVNPPRMTPRGYSSAVAQQLHNALVNGQYSTRSSGGSWTSTPDFTPFYCTIKKDERLTVEVGKYREEDWYPFVDTIRTPVGSIEKWVTEEIDITSQHGWIGYIIIGTTGTLQYWDEFAGVPPNTSACTYWVLAEVWCDDPLTRILRLMQQHQGTVDVAAGGYGGPFGVSIDPSDDTKVIVGANRDTGIPIPNLQLWDSVIIHPEVIYEGYHQHVQCTDFGLVYLEVTRQGVAAVSVPMFAAGKYPPTWPTSTPAIMVVPLAQVGWELLPAPHITGVYQHQFGNIICDRTTANYCSP